MTEDVASEIEFEVGVTEDGVLGIGVEEKIDGRLERGDEPVGRIG